MSEPSHWQAREGLELISIEGEIALFDTESLRTVLLNRAASDVLTLLDGQTTVDEVASILARAYGVALERVRPDVDEAVSMLREAGVITGASG